MPRCSLFQCVDLSNSQSAAKLFPKTGDTFCQIIFFGDAHCNSEGATRMCLLHELPVFCWGNSMECCLGCWAGLRFMGLLRGVHVRNRWWHPLSTLGTSLPTLFLVFCSLAASTILHSPSDWRTSIVIWLFCRLSPSWTSSVQHHLNSTQQKSKTRHALPSVVFGLFNCNLNKLAHNQCLGRLSKSSLSSKPPSKHGLLYSFCTEPWLLSTLWSSARGSLRYGTSLRHWLSPKSLSSSITELKTKMSLETAAVSPLIPHLLRRYCAPHSTATPWVRLIPESALLLLLLSKVAYTNNISITWFFRPCLNSVSLNYSGKSHAASDQRDTSPYLCKLTDLLQTLIFKHHNNVQAHNWQLKKWKKSANHFPPTLLLVS